MSNALESLLQRRLLIVTGKGGTGKTTLAAALGVLAARRGLDTVLVEVADQTSLLSLVAKDPAAVPAGDGRQPVAIAPHLYNLCIVPEVALTEYLELRLHVPGLVARVIRQSGFRRLLEAAPGWRELITLGKLWHLHTLERNGGPRWQLLIVDAPATGHGLSFLSVPKVVVDTVHLGPLHRHTVWVQELLTDPARTLVLPVTLPEELPVRETLELVARVEALGLTTGPLVANGVEPVPEVSDLDGIVAALEAEQPPDDLAALLEPTVIRASVQHALRRAALQRVFLDTLSAPGRRPLISLPHLADGVFDPDGLGELVTFLEAALLASEPFA